MMRRITCAERARASSLLALSIALMGAARARAAHCSSRSRSAAAAASASRRAASFDSTQRCLAVAFFFFSVRFAAPESAFEMVRAPEARPADDGASGEPRRPRGAAPAGAPAWRAA